MIQKEVICYDKEFKILNPNNNLDIDNIDTLYFVSEQTNEIIVVSINAFDKNFNFPEYKIEKLKIISRNTVIKENIHSISSDNVEKFTISNRYYKDEYDNELVLVNSGTTMNLQLNGYPIFVNEIYGDDLEILHIHSNSSIVYVRNDKILYKVDISNISYEILEINNIIDNSTIIVQNRVSSKQLLDKYRFPGIVIRRINNSVNNILGAIDNKSDTDDMILIKETEESDDIRMNMNINAIDLMLIDDDN